MRAILISVGVVLACGVAWFAWSAISAPTSDGRATPRQISTLEESLAAIEPALARGAYVVAAGVDWRELSGACVATLTRQAERLAARPPRPGSPVPIDDTCRAGANDALLGSAVYASSRERAALANSVPGLRVFETRTSVWFTPEITAACAATLHPERLNLQINTSGRHELFCG